MYYRKEGKSLRLKCLANIRCDKKLFEKLKWVALGLVLLFFFAASLYPDLVITYTHSLNFWDCVFSGNLSEFYTYTLERQFEGFPADYYIIIYIIFGIWNLPIWIFTKLFGMDPYCVGALLWARLLIIVSLIGILWTIYEIFKILGEDQDEHVYYMICSSVLCVFPSFIMGQYDAISLFFLMLGILQCMKEDRISWKTLLMFAVAIPIKTLAIFPVILIILHKEKRILHIIKDVALSVVGLALCILPFMNNAGYQEAMTYNGGWLTKISRASIACGWDQGISIFWLCFFGMCVAAYAIHEKSKEEYLEQITWILTAFYVLFFGFTPAHPQWSVLMVPFLMILIRKKNRNYVLNILLEMIAGFSLILLQAYYFGWVYFTDTTSWLILKNTQAFSDIKGIDSLREIFDKMLPPETASILHAAYLAVAAAIVIINNPWNKKPVLKELEQESIQDDILMLDWLRIAILVGYVLVTFVVVYII